jgi:hypothetical protein
LLCYTAGEIPTYWIQRVGGEFGKGSPQPLLDAINTVEEGPACDTKHSAANVIIASAEVVQSENAILGIIQHSPADQAKISHVFFPFSRIDTVARWASARLPSYPVNVRSEGPALPKAAIAGAKNGPQHAIARCFRFPENGAQTEPVAEAARGLGETNRHTAIPLKGIVAPIQTD